MEVDDSLNLGSFAAEADVGDLTDSEDALSVHFNWTVEQEILLFEAMIGHKPVGVDKNIHMMCIHRKLHAKWRPISKSSFITPEHIWAKLGSMYDLEALDESECLPFPEDIMKNQDFLLPNDEFGPLMSGFPTTNSGNSSRSSTVDRDIEDEPATNNGPSSRDETPTIEETLPSAPSPVVASTAASVAASTPIAATISTIASSSPTTIAATAAATSVTATTTAAATSTPIAAPSTPAATSTPTSTKPGRKRSKTANQSENEKTPSGPSSAKRSRR